VPSVSTDGQSVFANTKSSISVWPGLGGDRITSQLFQAGSESDVVCGTDPNSCTTSYYPWWQWYSSAMPYECVIQNGPISVGDQIYALVETVKNGAYDSSTSANVCYYVSAYDPPTNTSWSTGVVCFSPGQTNVCPGSGQNITLPSSYPGGASIEWILENSQQHIPLLLFGDVPMSDTWGIQMSNGVGSWVDPLSAAGCCLVTCPSGKVCAQNMCASAGYSCSNKIVMANPANNYNWLAQTYNPTTSSFSFTFDSFQ
jgi:hypothetical protein